MSNIEYYEQNAEQFFQRTVGADLAATRAQFVGAVRSRDGVRPSGPPRVLDVGCGSGRDARAFRELGFEVVATEMSPKLAALARAHAGVPVHVMTFEQIPWRAELDGVWACASLLHVPRRELPSTLGMLRDALVPGGALYMSFKYGTQEREEEGRTFTDLDEALAASLLTAAGGLTLRSMDTDIDERGTRWLELLCHRAVR